MTDRLQLIFSMCDRQGEGRVRRHEFAELIKSLNTALGVAIDGELQNDVIENLLHRSGQHKREGKRKKKGKKEIEGGKIERQKVGEVEKARK